LWFLYALFQNQAQRLHNQSTADSCLPVPFSSSYSQNIHFFFISVENGFQDFFPEAVQHQSRQQDHSCASCLDNNDCSFFHSSLSSIGSYACGCRGCGSKPLLVRWISFHLSKQFRHIGSRLPFTGIEGPRFGLPANVASHEMQLAIINAYPLTARPPL
jgi:hypothetical protein